MQGKKQKQKQKILKSPYTKHIACFTSRKFLALSLKPPSHTLKLLLGRVNGPWGAVATPPSLYQDKCPPLARGQVLHLTVPLWQPSRVTARSQPGEALWEGPRGQSHWASTDVQVGIQELRSRGHRGHASLEEGCRQQRDPGHEEAVTGSEHAWNRAWLGARLAARRGERVVLQLEQPLLLQHLFKQAPAFPTAGRAALQA